MGAWWWVVGSGWGGGGYLPVTGRGAGRPSGYSAKCGGMPSAGIPQMQLRQLVGAIGSGQSTAERQVRPCLSSEDPKMTPLCPTCSLEKRAPGISNHRAGPGLARRDHESCLCRRQMQLRSSVYCSRMTALGPAEAAGRQPICPERQMRRRPSSHGAGMRPRSRTVPTPSRPPAQSSPAAIFPSFHERCEPRLSLRRTKMRPPFSTR